MGSPFFQVTTIGRDDVKRPPQTPAVMGVSPVPKAPGFFIRTLESAYGGRAVTQLSRPDRRQGRVLEYFCSSSRIGMSRGKPSAGAREGPRTYCMSLSVFLDNGSGTVQPSFTLIGIVAGSMSSAEDNDA